MALLKPFAAWLANKAFYQRIIAPPYDVITKEDVITLGKENSCNIVHVTRAEVSMDTNDSVDLEQSYSKAKSALDTYMTKELFIEPSEKSYCIYRISRGMFKQTGIVGMLELKEKEIASLKKHEHTRQKKVDDRARLLSTIKTQISPVLLTINKNESLSKQLAIHCNENQCHFSAEDNQGFCHQVWPLTFEQSQQIEKSFNCIDNYYIADGHHRCEAALRSQGDKPVKQILSAVFAENELRILGYHRLIKTLNGLTESDIITRCKNQFSINKSTAPVLPTNKGQFGMYLNETWYELNTMLDDELDVNILHQRLIEPVFAINDVRADERIDFVGGDDAINIIESKIKNGEFKIGFTLAPTEVAQVIQVADNNEVMPPKSTWFEPKLLDGFFIHQL
jgi:uncharacterized protein (DUF1015 family)